MEVVAGAVAALTHDAVADDDVGVPGVGQPAAGFAGRRQQHDVAVGQRGEVGDQAVQPVAALHQHQPAGRAEECRRVVDAPREVGVGQRLVGRADREPRAVAGEVEHPGSPGTGAGRGWSSSVTAAEY